MATKKTAAPKKAAQKAEQARPPRATPSRSTTCVRPPAPAPPRPAWVVVRAARARPPVAAPRAPAPATRCPTRFEGGQTPLHMRLPKLRGFKNPFRTEYQVVNLDRLGELFPDGGTVGVSDLVAKGAVRKGEKVKVLGTGDISVKVDVTADKFSASAKDKIAAAGGSTTEL